MKECPECEKQYGGSIDTCANCGVLLDDVVYVEQCPKCYGEVDERAQVCPHCGKKLKADSAAFQIGSLIMALMLFTMPIALWLGGFGFAFVVGFVQVVVGLFLRKH